jgi:cytochrome c553
MLCDLSIVQLSQGAKNMIKTSISSLGIAVCMAMGVMASAQAAVDVEAAKALAKANDCLKCHAADKDKKGPSMKKIAAKYQRQARRSGKGHQEHDRRSEGQALGRDRGESTRSSTPKIPKS